MGLLLLQAVAPVALLDRLKALYPDWWKFNKHGKLELIQQDAPEFMDYVIDCLRLDVQDPAGKPPSKEPSEAREQADKAEEGFR